MEPNITDAFSKVDEIKEEDTNDIPSNLANITSNWTITTDPRNLFTIKS